jgi:hypothetical protein
MKRHQSLLLALTMPSIGFFSLAQAQPTPSSAVACHFVGRGYLNLNADGQGAGEVAGYFTDIAGITDSLFKGTPSERTAFLTFRSDLVSLTPLPANGVIALERASAGTFNIYFNPAPSGDWTNPDTFSGDSSFPGKPIAHFTRRESLFFQTEALSRHDVTETLISSSSFILNGHRYDFDAIAPGGVTLQETYSNTPVSAVTGFPIVLPFAGNCLAVADEGQ